jgi:hypothetical protein
MMLGRQRSVNIGNENKKFVAFVIFNVINLNHYEKNYPVYLPRTLL